MPSQYAEGFEDGYTRGLEHGRREAQTYIADWHLKQSITFKSMLDDMARRPPSDPMQVTKTQWAVVSHAAHSSAIRFMNLQLVFSGRETDHDHRHKV